MLENKSKHIDPSHPPRDIAIREQELKCLKSDENKKPTCFLK